MLLLPLLMMMMMMNKNNTTHTNFPTTQNSYQQNPKWDFVSVFLLLLLLLLLLGFCFLVFKMQKLLQLEGTDSHSILRVFFFCLFVCLFVSC
jgi:flagellar biogenesis protein FliO